MVVTRLIRFFHLDCFHLTFKLIANKIKGKKTSQDQYDEIPFQLFTSIQNPHQPELFSNIIKTFKWEIILGMIFTLIFTYLNLFTPYLFRELLELFHDNIKYKGKYFDLVQILLIVLVLKILFSQNAKRLFYELAIKIESSFAKMLVKKTLNITERDRLKQSSKIISLEHVYLKLIFNMFSDMYLAFQAPFTIILAIGLLFYTQPFYGLIAIYWFIIAVLLQIQINQKLSHCNKTKLKLIQQRSQINYELLENMIQAKIIGWQDVIIQKNNDLFQQQNIDHVKFYRYQSYYDITMLMLPVLVVISICIYDYNQQQAIAVEDVYLILAILTVLFSPMKSFRKLYINFHDGFIALRKMHSFFKTPDIHETNSGVLQIQKGSIIIAENTVGQFSYQHRKVQIKINCHLQVHKGQRMILLGKLKQGQHVFIQILTKILKVISGEVIVSGSLVYNSKNQFFTHQTISDNIKFFNNGVKEQHIRQFSERLGLKKDLDASARTMNSFIDDPKLYSQSQRSKILLVRTLCQDADIYIIEEPEQPLDDQAIHNLNLIMKEKQQLGKTIIFVPNNVPKFNDQDKVAILNQGQILQFGYYKDLLKSSASLIQQFIKKQQAEFLSPLKSQGSSFSKLKKAVKKLKLLKSFTIQKQQQTNKNKQIPDDLFHIFKILRPVFINYQQKPAYNYYYYLKQFLTCVSFKQTIYILITIAFAQFLHLFIHYYFGHLDQDNNYVSYIDMVVIEVLLTFGLAIVLYFQVEISSMICVIQGNILYSESLKSLIKQHCYYFGKEDRMQIAKKFNHDYQQIFMGSHMFLHIYKNIIIILATSYLVASNKNRMLIGFALVFLIYLSIFLFFRLAKSRVIRNYGLYRFRYSKTLEQSVSGANLVKLYKRQQQLIKRAQFQYKQLAKYKFAQSKTSFAASITCDIASTVLFYILIAYGLENMRGKHSIGLLATALHLLLDSARILRSTVMRTIMFQKFFSINIIPFMEYRKNKVIEKERNCVPKKQLDIIFDKVPLIEPGIQSYKPHPLLLKIKQGENVLICQVNDRAKYVLMLALTSNLSLDRTNQNQGCLKIGGQDITTISRQFLNNNIGVIMNKNFFMTGTLRQNIQRKQHINQQLAYIYLDRLHIYNDIPEYQNKGLQAFIGFQSHKINYQITKKIAMVRILLKKPKIVIIKDSSDFIGQNSITDMLKQYNQGCTIIRISSSVQSASHCDRIIYMDGHVVKEQGSPTALANDPLSKVGEKLRQCNFQSYKYINRVTTFQKPLQQK